MLQKSKGAEAVRSQGVAKVSSSNQMLLYFFAVICALILVL